MRALPLVVAVVAALALAPSLPARADDATTAITFTETAERELRHDRLRIHLRVEQTGTDIGPVQAEVNRRMAAALDRARAVPGLAIETGSYWVHRDEAGSTRPARWRASQTLTLAGSDTAALLQLAGQLQQEGLLLSGMGWELSREARRAVEDALTGEAIARLRARGETLATAMEARVLRFARIAVGNAGGHRPPMPGLRSAAMGDSLRRDVPVAGEPGTETVQVSIEAELLIRAVR
jgi:predicted secreted protein